MGMGSQNGGGEKTFDDSLSGEAPYAGLRLHGSSHVDPSHPHVDIATDWI